MSIDVESTVTPLEIDGQPHKVGDDRVLVVQSCFASRNCVEVVWNGQAIKVSADDLVAAIRNAQNVGD